MSHVDPSLCCFGAEAVLKRLEVMLRLTAKVRANHDLEAVHDMRVASRRTRTALELFSACFPARRVKQWNKRLRRVTRALGQARDTDVQVEFLRSFLKTTADRKLREGIRRLLLRLRQQRSRLQDDVVTALNRFETHGDLAQMQAALLQIKARGHQAPSEPVWQLARQAIRSQLEQMLAYEPYVQKPECIDQLHLMRIAAKHLRYTMEAFNTPLYEGALDDAIDAAKQVQRRLGEIHDCDVWVAFLPTFVEQEGQRTVEYFGREGPVRRLLPGIEHLKQQCQAQRQLLYESFVAFWQQIQEQGAWGRLLALLDRYPNPPASQDASPSPADQEPTV